MIHPRRATEENRSDERPSSPVIEVVGSGVRGAGFLPDHDVSICITYTEDDVSDYSTHLSDPGGELRAELHVSDTGGAVGITATDHRRDPDGVHGVLWSNTVILRN